MPKVTLWPQGESFEVESDTPLLKALREKGYYVTSSCGGVASCSDCVVKILSGEEHLSPQAYRELSLLGNVFHITKERLSCQTRVTGDVTIDISRHPQPVKGAGRKQDSTPLPVKEKEVEEDQSKAEIAEVENKKLPEVKRRTKEEIQIHGKRPHFNRDRRDHQDKQEERQGGFRRPKSFNYKTPRRPPRRDHNS